MTTAPIHWTRTGSTWHSPDGEYRIQQRANGRYHVYHGYPGGKSIGHTVTFTWAAQLAQQHKEKRR